MFLLRLKLEGINICICYINIIISSSSSSSRSSIIVSGSCSRSSLANVCLVVMKIIYIICIYSCWISDNDLFFS